jgi:hypothetical protein
VTAITAVEHKIEHVPPMVHGTFPVPNNGSNIVSSTINMSDIRELSLDEIDAVAGALKISIGGVINIAIGDGDMVFGFGIAGVGSFGVFSDGEVCGTLGPFEGCTGRPS